MLKKKEIIEILETKRFWFEKFKDAEYYRLAADYQAEINMLETILEIDENDVKEKNSAEVKQNE